MSGNEPATARGDLTAFQLRSVDHVLEQFYGPAHARRFLVADETGLGKTRVAQGVIAGAIQELQHDDSVERIDVVYVCSNTDLAKQNIRRLNVTGHDEIPFSSRLTLLGEHSRRLKDPPGTRNGKAVNLISFTPGTSFDMGLSLGWARERAMIALALLQLCELNGYQKTAVHVLLQGAVGSLHRFREHVDSLARHLGDEGIDEVILHEFAGHLERGGVNSLVSRLGSILDRINRKHYVPKEIHGDALRLVRDLRAALAASSVETLDPNLVILDEFQRFRHLLLRDNPAGELAHHLFEYKAARVLLLSATPYKPFTLAEEGDEDHATDLFATLGFLAEGRTDVDIGAIRSGLRAYREAVLNGDVESDVTDRIRAHLLKLMSRAERPSGARMTSERVTCADELRATEIADYASLHRIAQRVAQPQDRGLVSVEYWKSAPYFLTFCDGYHLGRRLKTAHLTPELTALLRSSQHIRADSLRRFQRLDPGNARMRVLADDTVGRGWWQLLWTPPSLPYMQPTGAYASPGAHAMTKRLVFSSWRATPSSVASILSYEAERHLAAGSAQYTSYTPETRRRIARRLQYSMTDGRPQNMSSLLIQWPLPGLAGEIDPLPWVADAGGEPLTQDVALARARDIVTARVGRMAAGRDEAAGPAAEAQDRHWRTVFGWPDSWPADGSVDEQALARALVGSQTEPESDSDPPARLTGLLGHINAARAARTTPITSADDDTIGILAEIGLFSPANIAYRTLGRLAGDGVHDWALFESAAVLANGVRSLFNRPDVMQLVDRAGAGNLPYWRKVLAYIAMGNLEAVLDEYLHQLLTDRTSGAGTDDLLRVIAREAAEALSLRSPTLRAADPCEPQDGPTFSARFALRYGGRAQNAEDVRQPEVRRAFNSPFWPFVLASTSVGQEGIDFHWWCHAVFHWNVPSNPVDFEQREGRVDRYRGHAIRKNIAAAHGRTALAVGGGNPWDRIYELARDRQAQFGDFSPGWVYPGPHRIERHVAPYAFSVDIERYERMKRDVARYRLTFGQPRQEDMLQLLERRPGVETDPETLDRFRIDLAP